MAKTEFILVNSRTSEIVDINTAEKRGLNDYIVEDENGSLTTYDGKKKWEFCLKVRKTPFKDMSGIELWEGDVIRFNERKAYIQYKDGKFHYNYLFDENGNENEVLEDLKRLYSLEARKAKYLYNVYRETGYEKDQYDFPDYNYYEDIIVSIEQLKKDQEKVWQDFLKQNPNTNKEEFDKVIEDKLKLLKKMKRDFEKNTTKS